MSHALPCPDHDAYARQLTDKQQLLDTLFAGLDVPPLEVFASAPQHYRMRAEFRIWHEDGQLCYAMFEGGQKASRATMQRIDQLPAACEAINALMPRLLAAVQANPVLATRWYQVEFLATLSGEMLVTMIYHRRLDEAWEEAARALQAQLGIFIIGRSKGQKQVLVQDFVTERLHIPGLPAADYAMDHATDHTTDHATNRATGHQATGNTMAHATGHAASNHATGEAVTPVATTRPGPGTQTAAPGGVPFLYRQPEGAFTQPNARMCEQMIGWACRVVQEADAATRDSAGTGLAEANSTRPDQHHGHSGPGGGFSDPGDDFSGPGRNQHPLTTPDMCSPRHTDLLELYCGNGNFTLPLSRLFRQVLATEVSKTSVHAAQWNIAANHCPNVRIARLSAEEFTEAMQGTRSFRRLREQEISLTDYRFSTVLVDPPRAGVDDATLALLQRFDRILYISCNPHTLRANLETLCRTHRIVRRALFDQFPFTPHIESSVLLVRRN